MQNRGAIAIEMLLNKQERLPAIYLNASDSEDAIVDEVSSVGFYLFFCCLGVWPDGMKSCIVCVELMYDEPLLIYEVFICMSMSIFVELARNFQQGASLASV